MSTETTASKALDLDTLDKLALAPSASPSLAQSIFVNARNGRLELVIQKGTGESALRNTYYTVQTFETAGVPKTAAQLKDVAWDLQSKYRADPDRITRAFERGAWEKARPRENASSALSGGPSRNTPGLVDISGLM